MRPTDADDSSLDVYRGPFDQFGQQETAIEAINDKLTARLLCTADERRWTTGRQAERFLMGDETSCYAGPAGVGFAHMVVDQLGEDAIPPTPPNYELWATYRSGAFPDLNRELDERLNGGGKLTPALCEDLFERYFTTTQSFEQLAQTGHSIAQELASALVHLRDANSSAGDYAGQLESTAANMEAATEPSAIRDLLHGLIFETRAVAARNRTLETQMAVSSKQMEALQVSMRQATVEAVTDGLTGLANRRYFDRVLSRQVREALEGGKPLCLVLCDIDCFKKVNDTWGHPVGDQVIRYVAAALRAGAPPDALAARYGGEEYALLLPGMQIAEAQAIAEELRQRVRARTLSRKSSGDVLGVITISIGVASLNDEGKESLVRRADACLYQAKREGRNRVICELSNPPVAA